MSGTVRKWVFVAALMVSLGWTTSTHAVISSDGNASVTGSVALDDGLGGAFNSTFVEYAVYAPGDFASSYGPFDDGGYYVYAYEVTYNSGLAPELTNFSVGLDGDEMLGVIGVVGGGASSNLGTSAVWTFAPSLGTGLTSGVLYFTAPHTPEMDNASSISSFGYGASGQVTSPSVLPEPTTAAMLAGMATLLAWRRRR